MTRPDETMSEQKCWELLRRYSESLDRGDLEGAAGVLDEAGDDPLLEGMIREADAPYLTDYMAAHPEAAAVDAGAIVRETLEKHDANRAEPGARDAGSTGRGITLLIPAVDDGADLVANLARQEIPSGFPSTEEEPPITVGCVMARVRESLRVRPIDQQTRALIERLINDPTPVPPQLSLPAAQRLFAKIGVPASSPVIEMFHRTAVPLLMGRGQGEALRAARRQGRTKKKPEG
jgi:hypothetical protein